MSIQDASSAAPLITEVDSHSHTPVVVDPGKDVVSTHVLVPEEQVDRLLAGAS